jgi:type IV pilus assembly protein PilE
MAWNSGTGARRPVEHPVRRASLPGMTLIELMIVVVVVAVLAAIALPNYREFSARARRAEAKAALLQVATNQERVYLHSNSYTTDMSRLGFANADCNPTDSAAYQVCVTAADANTFTAVATYQRADAEASKCLTFRIDGRGIKSSGPDSDCWTRTR